MTCAIALRELSFDCAQVGSRTIRVWSPFTMPGDGELLGVFVETLGDHYRVTDNAAAFRSSASRGMEVSKGRIRAIETLAPDRVRVAGTGEIVRDASAEELSGAIVDVLETMMLVGHHTLDWLQRGHRRDFEERVAQILIEAAGDRVRRKVTVVGASGRQLEFPFVVGLASPMYVQPVPYGRDRLSWDNVYRGHGRMHDLQLANVPAEQRVVVVEDKADDPQLGHALTLLSSVATVVPFSRMIGWARHLANVA